MRRKIIHLATIQEVEVISSSVDACPSFLLGDTASYLLLLSVGLLSVIASVNLSFSKYSVFSVLVSSRCRRWRSSAIVASHCSSNCQKAEVRNYRTPVEIFEGADLTLYVCPSPSESQNIFCFLMTSKKMNFFFQLRSRRSPREWTSAMVYTTANLDRTLLLPYCYSRPYQSLQDQIVVSLSKWLAK